MVLVNVNNNLPVMKFSPRELVLRTDILPKGTYLLGFEPGSSQLQNHSSTKVAEPCSLHLFKQRYYLHGSYIKSHEHLHTSVVYHTGYRGKPHDGTYPLGFEPGSSQLQNHSSTTVAGQSSLHLFKHRYYQGVRYFLDGNYTISWTPTYLCCIPHRVL